jgi:16S rRNA (cytosine967-C5)-methyltransferase
MNENNTRYIAVDSLNKIETHKKYSNLEIDSAIKRYNLQSGDKAFYTALVYGVTERRITLDYYIGKFSKLPLKKLDMSALNILRSGMYQILYMSGVADSAACDESVKLCKAFKITSAGTFVNAVLRGFCRKKDTLDSLLPERQADIVKYLSVRYSVAEWIAKLWTNQYGDDRAESILKAFEIHPEITFRPNTLKGDAKDSYTLDDVKSGLCFVQDRSSQMCVELSGAKAGDFVIDMCAAPGGKSFGCAMRMNNSGRILAFDIHENKLSLVKNGADRLGISIIETAVGDATAFNEAYKDAADVVLCDVPCSGLGVLSKKPEIRCKPEPESDALPAMQYAILSNGAKYTRVGGTLVYSACTLSYAENGAVTERFLRTHENFKLVDEMTFFPDSNATDGFYTAKFTKDAGDAGDAPTFFERK